MQIDRQPESGGDIDSDRNRHTDSDGKANRKTSIAYIGLER